LRIHPHGEEQPGEVFVANSLSSFVFFFVLFVYFVVDCSF
jgi:hypothetical protein